MIEGIVRLSATLRHSPLVFQLVRMRQRLAAAAELYVPCSTPLLEVIRSPALFKKVALLYFTLLCITLLCLLVGIYHIYAYRR